MLCNRKTRNENDVAKVKYLQLETNKSRNFIKNKSFGSADFLSSPLKRAYTKRTLKCVLQAFVPKIFIPHQREYSQEFRKERPQRPQRPQCPQRPQRPQKTK